MLNKFKIYNALVIKVKFFALKKLNMPFQAFIKFKQ